MYPKMSWDLPLAISLGDTTLCCKIYYYRSLTDYHFCVPVLEPICSRDPSALKYLFSHNGTESIRQ